MFAMVKLYCAPFNVCEDNFKFKNQRCKPIFLAAPLIAANRINFAINRALLTV